ncbi:thymidine kinase [Photobacterium damselae subsp. piscicida]|uniref:Thymidine kinase n=1 Tax=Photobacterium damsela subsp. piscicida TaxID=38294 RepID=A0A1Q9H6G2_PHODP|nr:thymidine kinase [Photobacterium damselae]MBE8129656.1 thymidine kinase [Photobacterium damselae subsp. piscicida]MDP2543005.1 thymidine kinase [Photobacterium damselae subsp. piscicida]MDP2559160.1 thymidine kinase [Photobacterium damselae subsp. piscicida]OLQ83316.1 thymidine kinase [Photobacterium damselae subsp. piscicida]PSV56716.1 thymidine kinase [Photobacterium damselae]
MAQMYFYYSAMNAGKSTTLLQSSFNYRERGMTPLIFTAAIDDRYGKGKVSSRIGLQEDAELFNNADDLYAQITDIHNEKKIDCVLIDECQFLTKDQVYQLTEVVDKLHIPVLCYGLRTDFRGELFEGSRYLLSWADKLVELKTICHCGRKANMVIRQDETGRAIVDGDQVEIGGNDRYVSVCRTHYKEALGR